jgi:N-acetylmuramic acid 6-phosphate etherase
MPGRSSATTRALPTDRSHVQTEQRHPRSAALDAMSVREIVDLMIDDQRAVIEALGRGSGALTSFIDALVPRMARGGRLVYVGAGTSGRLGVLDASECPPTFQSDPSRVVGVIAGGDAALRQSSEGREDEPDGAHDALRALNLTPVDTVLGIAAGGTTPYVLGALDIAKSMGAMTGLLTCALPASSPQHCDNVIVLATGPEVVTGSTRLKAGTATKIAINIITTAAFVRLGKTWGNLMVDLRASNDKLTDRAIRILVEACPRLNRAGAMQALEQAEGSLKIAIVMQRLRVDLSEARSLLEGAGGRLRDALDSPGTPGS